jgi:DNA-binding FadR family transcriptional regulator
MRVSSKPVLPRPSTLSETPEIIGGQDDNCAGTAMTPGPFMLETSDVEIRSRRGHMVTDLTARLRQQITQGDFGPGDRLPSEASLSETHGVSRTVVREAIASLRADGMVESRQGSGVYVLPAQPVADAPFQNVDYDRISSIVEMLELRTAVESEAAALAAVRRSPAQEERIIECLQGLLDSGTARTSTAEADWAFHLAIAEASNNARFAEFLCLLGVNSIPRRALHAESETQQIDSAYLALIAREHRRIVDAILDGDPEAARISMRAHLDGSLSRYRKLLRDRAAAVPA